MAKGEDRDAIDIDEPLFNPKTFFKDTHDPKLDEYRLKKDDLYQQALSVGRIRQKIKQKADKVEKLLSTEEEKEVQVSEQVKAKLYRGTS